VSIVCKEFYIVRLGMGIKRRIALDNKVRVAIVGILTCPFYAVTFLIFGGIISLI